LIWVDLFFPLKNKKIFFSRRGRRVRGVKDLKNRKERYLASVF
jgi:hypothetical protein